MSSALTPGQHALLEAALVRRQHELERTLHTQLGDQDRVAHAREQLLQDLDGETAHEADREVDLARSDRGLQALREIGAALTRLREDADYGRCTDCGAAIPFDRLKLQPEALRCVACQGALERQAGLSTPSL
ncbi:TraR/DksA family transcriptional regulator [Pelomonas sp. CA6]|uniref:TraR/DksA family transcriptional regulator n=1 Tax=Pelomonas sp. CA6 TaxID=2907999 RepID=UPI001F4B576C|nr:TraR/DksA family transcriptional regulator [Pelomonas sp. CA6]MCH7342750.1 TraR/DksA family transcriptional regulator [Pelomonas sp. CA6]